METLIIFALFIGVMWLLLIRPQQKRQKQHREMIDSLSVGDDVVTVGGMHGRIDAVAEGHVDLEVTDEIVLRFQKQSIARNLSTGQEGDAGR